MFQRLVLSAVLVSSVADARSFDIAGNVTRWVDGQKRSLKNLAPAGAEGRLLADESIACNLMAVFGVALPMIMAAIPMILPEMYATKSGACDMMSKMEACNSKSKEDCHSGCEWAVGEKQCNFFFATTINNIVNPDAGTPMAAWYSEANKCNKIPEATCAENGCSWNAGEFKCEVGGAWTEGETAICKTTGWHAVIDMSMACGAAGATDAESCSKLSGELHCEWNKDQSKCDVSGEHFIKATYGDKAGPAFMKKGAALEFCAKDEACGEGCKKIGEECAMSSTSEFTEGIMMKGQTCKKKTSSTCSGDCEMSTNGRRLGAHDGGGEAKPTCDIAESYMKALCDATDGDATDGATSVFPFTSLLLAVAFLFGQF